MRALDLENAVPLCKDIFWVGTFDEERKLHTSPYLLVDDEEAVLFDPGSFPYFPAVMRKIIDTVEPSSISHIILSHQDPDISAALPVIEDVIERADLKIVVHSLLEDTVRMLGAKAEVVTVDEEHPTVTLKSGRVLKIISAAYLHSPGAIAIYDETSRTLFSGAVFGAMMSKDWQLYPMKNYIERLKSYHQQHMPSGAILTEFIGRIAKLKIDRILSNEGAVIEGALVEEAIEALRGLPCGFDLKNSHGVK